MPVNVFNVASEFLWEDRQIIGLRIDGCCGRQCGFMYTYHLVKDNVWRLLNVES